MATEQKAFVGCHTSWVLVIVMLGSSLLIEAHQREPQGLSRTLLKRFEGRSYRTNDQCIRGGPIQHLNFDAGAWLNIFIDMPFTCDGVTIGYDYYVKTTGTLHIGVWRPVRGGTYARLIAKDQIPNTWTGPIKAYVPDQSQLPFRAGDWLGLHYSDEAADAGGGVVPYEDARNGICCGMTSSDLGRFHNSYHRDSSLPVGVEVQLEIIDFTKRIPAIQPMTRSTGGGVGPPAPGPVTTTSPIRPPTGNCGVPAITPNTPDRIVGGHPAKRHSLPWMASLQTGSGWHFCGGSLIHNQWVVTASHCTPMWEGMAYSERNVALGVHLQSTSDYAERTLNVHRVYDHDHFDISLIRLASPVTYTAEISSICVPPHGLELSTGTICYTSGWGTTSSGGYSSDELLQVGVPLVSQSTCNQADWYDGGIGDYALCAGYEWGGADSCQGDSGGPLMCKVGGKWTLIGVVSWGDGCAFAKKPGVYTKVSYVTDWINAHLEAYGDL